MIVLVGSDFHRHIFHNLKTIGFQAHTLHGVVGDETHLCHTEVAEYLSSHTIVALVGIIAQMHIGIYRIESFFLQLIGCDFCHQSDATALLVEVEHKTFAFFFDEFHRLVELCSAVATATAEDVARDATRMHAHKEGFTGFPIAFEKGYVLQTIAFLTIRNEAKITIFCGHAHFFSALDERFFLQTIGDEVFDGDDFESFLHGKLFELWHTCHGAVFVEDFNQASHGLKSCQARQVNSGFGVSSACEHTTILRIEGIDVSRTSEPFGASFGISQSADSSSAVVCGNASGATFEEVYGHREGSA